MKDSQGFASKEAIRGVYDGSIFDYIEGKIKGGDKSLYKEVELQKINPEKN